MNIYFDDPYENNEHERTFGESMKDALLVICGKEGIDEDAVEVSCSFVSAEEIRRLNREYRDTDKVTDVLSFPQYETKKELIEVMDMTGVAELGDVVICMERAKEQAEEFGHPLKREVIYLFVHSILHLLGYDHMEEDDKKVMRSREEEIMNEIGITR